MKLNEPIAIIEVTKEEFSGLSERGDILLEGRETKIITGEGLEYKLSTGDMVIARCSVNKGGKYFCDIESVCSARGTIKLKKYNAAF